MNRKILSLLFAIAACSPPKKPGAITKMPEMLSVARDYIQNPEDILHFEACMGSFSEREDVLPSAALVYNYMKWIINTPFGIISGKYLTVFGTIPLFTKQAADKQAAILKERFNNWDNPLDRMAIETGINRAMKKYIYKIPDELFEVLFFHNYPFAIFMTECILNNFPSSNYVVIWEKMEFCGKALLEVSKIYTEDNHHLIISIGNQILDRVIALSFEHNIRMSKLLKYINNLTPKEIKDRVHQAFMEEVRMPDADHNQKIKQLTWAVSIWANMCSSGPNTYQEEKILELAQLHLDILSEEMSRNYQLNNEQFQKTWTEIYSSMIPKYKAELPEQQITFLDRLVPKLLEMQIGSFLSTVKEPVHWGQVTSHTWIYESTYTFMQNIEEMSKNWICPNPYSMFNITKNRELFDRVKAYCQQIQNTSEIELTPQNQFQHTIVNGLIKFPIRAEIFKRIIIYKTAWLCQTENASSKIATSISKNAISLPDYKPIAHEWFEKAIEDMRDMNEIMLVITPMPDNAMKKLYSNPKILPIVQKAYMDARTSVEHVFVAMMSVTIKEQDNGAIETQSLLKAMELARTDLDYEMIAIALERTKNKEAMEKIGISIPVEGRHCQVM